MGINSEIEDGEIPNPKPKDDWGVKPIKIPVTYNDENPEEEIQTRAICDDTYERKLVDTTLYPYCLVCELQIKFRHLNNLLSATGFFISKRCVITAAHTIYKAGNYAKHVTVYPGANGNKKPFGSATTSKLRVPSKYKTNPIDIHDYGVVFLENDDLYNEIGGFFGFKNFDDSETAAIPGYANDKTSIQRESRGSVAGSQSILKYRIDTVDGISGGPLLQNSNDQFYAVGIHIGGSCPNKAVHIKNKVYSNLKKWKQESI